MEWSMFEMPIEQDGGRLPERAFHIFSNSKSVDWRVWTATKRSIDIFTGSKLVGWSVRSPSYWRIKKLWLVKVPVALLGTSYGRDDTKRSLVTKMNGFFERKTNVFFKRYSVICFFSTSDRSTALILGSVFRINCLRWSIDLRRGLNSVKLYWLGSAGFRCPKRSQQQRL